MIFFLIILDQITKGVIQSKFYLGESIPVIEGFFNLTYVQNPGAAWGVGRNFEGWVRVVFLLTFPVAICGYFFYWMIQTLKGPLHLSLSLALVVAGAVGNLIDRFTLEYVVDFLDFYIKQSHFPAFNVADSCVSVGACLLVLEFAFLEPKRQKKNNATQS